MTELIMYIFTISIMLLYTNDCNNFALEDNLPKLNISPHYHKFISRVSIIIITYGTMYISSLPGFGPSLIYCPGRARLALALSLHVFQCLSSQEVLIVDLVRWWACHVDTIHEVYMNRPESWLSNRFHISESSSSNWKNVMLVFSRDRNLKVIR